MPQLEVVGSPLMLAQRKLGEQPGTITITPDDVVVGRIVRIWEDEVDPLNLNI